MNHRRVIDGELVDAPRILTAAPAGPDRQVLICDRHGAGCNLDRPGCVQHFIDPDPPDNRTWTQRRSTFRVLDRRRTDHPGRTR